MVKYWVLVLPATVCPVGIAIRWVLSVITAIVLTVGRILPAIAQQHRHRAAEVEEVVVRLHLHLAEVAVVAEWVARRWVVVWAAAVAAPWVECNPRSFADSFTDRKRQYSR